MPNFESDIGAETRENLPAEKRALADTLSAHRQGIKWACETAMNSNNALVHMMARFDRVVDRALKLASGVAILVIADALIHLLHK